MPSKITSRGGRNYEANIGYKTANHRETANRVQSIWPQDKNTHPKRFRGIHGLSKASRGLKPKYGMEHKKLLEFLWELLYCPSSRRLKASLKDVMNHMTADLLNSFSETVMKEVLHMSHGTMDRLLRSDRKAMKPWLGLSTTKPGSMLKDQIPIMHGTDWEDTKPDFVEIDLPAHCGDSSKGECLLTPDCTDIASGWTECRAVINTARTHTLTAMKTIQRQLPLRSLRLTATMDQNSLTTTFFNIDRIKTWSLREVAPIIQTMPVTSSKKIGRLLEGLSGMVGSVSTKRFSFSITSTKNSAI